MPKEHVSSANPGPKRASGWISPQELANALDVRIDYLRRDVLPSLAPGLVRKEGGKTQIHGRSAIDAHLYRRALREARKAILAEQAASAQQELNEELAAIETLLLHSIRGEL